MFMISALGMAVSLNYTEKSNSQNIDDNRLSIIESDELEKELMKLQIKKTLLSNNLPDNEQWLYLLNNPIDDIIEDLLDAYLGMNYLDRSTLESRDELLVNNISTYLSISNKARVIDALYARIIPAFKGVIILIDSLKLFSPKHIQKLMKENHIYVVIHCLAIQKSFYTSDDLVEMKQIVTQLNELPDKGKIETVKGVLSKAKEKYICPDGHIRDVEEVFCGSSECGKNIKGLVKYQVDMIDSYKEKVETLSQLFSK